MALNQITRSQIMSAFWSNTAQGSSGTSQSNGATSGIFGLATQAFTDKVTLSLGKVGRKVIHDLATVTANCLKDKPDLASDYALVVIDKNDGTREVRAYRREDLTAGLTGDEKAKVLSALKKNTLLHLTSDKGLPAQPDNSGLKELASKAQAFVNRNQKLLNLLDSKGVLNWS